MGSASNSSVEIQMPSTDPDGPPLDASSAAVESPPAVVVASPVTPEPSLPFADVPPSVASELGSPKLADAVPPPASTPQPSPALGPAHATAAQSIANAPLVVDRAVPITRF